MALSLPTNIVIITLIFSILALVSVVLRFFARYNNRSPVLLDDLLIVGGLLFALGLSVCTVCAVYLGNLGRHVSVSPQGIPQYGVWINSLYQALWAGLLIQILAFAFIKASIVVFYRRIFRGKWFRRSTTVIIVVIYSWTISFFFASLFQCIPVSQGFLPTWERTGKCYDPHPMFVSMASTNLIIDIAILAIPQPLVWRLNMPRRRRVLISLVFLLGGFYVFIHIAPGYVTATLLAMLTWCSIVGVSAARIYFFHSIVANPRLWFDVTYNTAAAFYWTNLDTCVAVICASLPSIHPLLVHLSPGKILRSFASMVSMRSSNRISSTPPPESEFQLHTMKTSSTLGLNEPA
ncbi:hypothetical protein F5Y12DRAFT_749647 [Xylaria sp. FL1777]|nr:hypothetical protein F5Y12DRAFT_749647 [Xylaria sp. FL1777]